MHVVLWVILAVVVAGNRHCPLRLGPVPRQPEERRYRRRRLSRPSEVFIDPATGKRMRVWYDPATGDREYRPE